MLHLTLQIIPSLAAYVDIVTDEVKKRTGLDPLKTQMNIYTYCDS